MERMKSLYRRLEGNEGRQEKLIRGGESEGEERKQCRRTERWRCDGEERKS